MQQPVGERVLHGGWLLNYLIRRMILRQRQLRKRTCIRLEVSCCRYAMHHLCWSMIYWNIGEVLTCHLPYHHLSRDEQVIFAIAKGVPPKRPDEASVTEHRWNFIEWCWSPAKGTQPRPSSDEIVQFTEDDLTKIMMTEGLAERTANLVM